MNTQLYDCSFSNRAFRKNLRERQHERLRWILDILGRQRLVQHPFVGAGTRAASVSPCRLTPGQTALAGGRSRRRSREWRNGTARRPSANPPSDGTVRSGIARRSERYVGGSKACSMVANACGWCRRLTCMHPTSIERTPCSCSCWTAEIASARVAKYGPCPSALMVHGQGHHWRRPRHRSACPDRTLAPRCTGHLIEAATDSFCERRAKIAPANVRQAVARDRLPRRSATCGDSDSDAAECGEPPGSYVGKEPVPVGALAPRLFPGVQTGRLPPGPRNVFCVAATY